MTPSASALAPLRVSGAVLIPNAATALAKTVIPGTLLEGRVLQSANNQTLIAVAGKRLAFQLPGQWAAGDHLQLLYLGGSSRPAFLLTTSAGTSLPDRVGLSSTAQSLLGLPPAESGSGLRSLQPLLPQPPSESAPLAQLLQQSITQSGLFYESHLAAWAQGQWSLQSLRAEPQNASLLPVPEGLLPQAIPVTQRPRSLQSLRAEPQNASLLPVPEGLLPQAIPVTQRPRAEVPAPAASQIQKRVLPDRVAGAMTYTQIADFGKPPIASMTGDLAGLVARQIQVLNQQQITWSGAVWPGQFVQWMASRCEERAGEEARSPMTTSETGPHWDSTLTLHMPHLGNIQAKLHLHRDTLSLAITADQAAALKNHWGDLKAALRALGLRVTQHEIRAFDG
ncbi:flagellar hook-length control protein FliK [Acidithiobacillus sp.]|jgi:hypothetical protein|uniref:flagellar hook-length control protein FliK n=1 Tax=Acidithiobacillus sp. TaxID=1872118 RepID=UPI0025C2D0D6|nr:flagellar hook-length control protein FliK [Acidithiobacillus sp.]MCK9187643.1 flagellar hook-length control protein FliK [Acidithiobacillus sp.]MCK9358533.1 flagellar hook-length control protein FliK [Acidithiobacillus sp.]